MERFYQVVQCHRQLRPIAPASSGTSSGLEEALHEAAINPMAPVEPQLNWTLPQGDSCGLAAAHFRCLASGGAQRGRAAQSEPDHRNALRQGQSFRREKLDCESPPRPQSSPAEKSLPRIGSDDTDNERSGFINENRHRFMLMQAMVQKFFPDCTLPEFPVKLGP